MLFGIVAVAAFTIVTSIIIRGFKESFQANYYTYLAEDSQNACECVVQIRVTTSGDPVRHTDSKCRIAIYRTFAEGDKQRPFKLRNLVIKREGGVIVYERDIAESQERGALITQGTKNGLVSKKMIEHYVYIDVNINHDGSPIDVQCTVEDDVSVCGVSKRFLAEHHQPWD